MNFIINRKTTISMLFIGLTLLGVVSYKQLKVELFPNVELPFLYVQASYRGDVDPKFMENQIVIPIEGAIGTLDGVESIESNITSQSGSIVVYYQKNVNFKYAYLKLQERINEIQSSLPDGAVATVNKVDLKQMNSRFMELQVRGSGGVDRVRNMADQEIVPELENIDGIAAVTVYGGREKTLEIAIDPDACEAYNITPAQVRSLLSQNSQSRTYVGNLKDKDRLFFVHVTGEYDKVSDIEDLVVADGPVLLKDIAEVSFGVKEETSYSRVNGKDAVTVQLVNDSQTNMIDLSHNTRKVIDQLNEKLKYKDIEISIQNDSAETMETNIDQIINLALLGGILAIFVLWIFLKNIRIVAFIALAIPVSVYTAFNFFYAFGITLNSLTLVGMALAIGMLLDNSVVVLENIYRLSGKGYVPDLAVTQGTSEVWRSIVAATLTTIAVFLPFIFSTNYMVEMLGYNVGVSIISTLVVSLVAALLLVPMSTHYLLKRRRTTSLTFEKVTTNNRMVQIYMLLLKSCMRNPMTTIIGATVIFFLTIFISLAVSVSSLQEVEKKGVSIYVTMPSGSSLEKTDETVANIEGKLEGLQETQDVVCKIEEEKATISVSLKEDYEDIADRSYAEIKSDIERRVRSVRNADISFEETQGTSGFSGGSRNMMANFQRLMGIGSEQEKIVLKGQDFAQMQQVAEDLDYYLDEMESVNWVRVNVSNNRPEVHLLFDPLLMTEYDISLGNVTSGLGSFQKEISTGISFKQGVDEYDIIIKNKGAEEEEDEDDRNMEDLKHLQITDANSGLHDLQEFTNVIYASGLAGINRVNQEKNIEITYSFVNEADESKELLEAYRSEIDQLIANYNLPSGVAAEVVHEENDLDDFYFLIGAAVLLIFMILASVFESLSMPFVLMFTIPLAGIGSFLALIFTGNSLLNANTLTGFLILIGIVVNNGIILIDYTNILRKRGFRRSRALMTAGLSRVRPILITAITTIVAMVPLAMGNAEYVSVIGAPFAIIVIGGLAVSTLLTLIFIPTLYSGMEGFFAWFRGLNWRLMVAQFVIMIAGTFYIYVTVDSGLWQAIDFLLLLVIVPAAVWFVLSSLKKAQTKLVGENDSINIVIRNLVKIYDRPSRFSREWRGGINIRRRAGFEKEYKSFREFDQLVWQIPLLVFLCYFTFFYLSSALWITLMSVIIYWYINTIWKPFSYYLYHVSEAKGKKWPWAIARWGSKLFFWFLPLPELFMLWKNTRSAGLLIVVFVLWYLALVVFVTSKKLYEEKVNIERITGRFGGLRRALLRLVKQIPLIGKRRSSFKALNGVSLKIETGMFGLLGPNGAGKSTMMRIICGVFEQSYGKIWINGIDTQEKREELQGMIGYLPQEFGTYENMPAEDFLDYQAILKGMTDQNERKERVAYVLTAVHMYDRRRAKIGSFSGGMKQRIGIAQILLHLPKILVVDEPTAGLDPRERIRFRNLLVELSRERIVIFSTHIIEDIASSCNQVAVINRGRVKYNGTPVDMVHLANNLVWQLDIPATDFDQMQNKQMVIHHMRQGEQIRVRMLSKTKPAPDAVVVKPMLEDAYLCLIKDLK